MTVSDSEPTLSEPDVLVRAFAEAWSAWETKMYREDISMSDEGAIREHKLMIERFCTNKPRKYVDGLLSVQHPPTYSEVVGSDELTVQFVNLGRAFVDNRGSQQPSYRFVVLKKTEGWRIDSVKWRVSEDDSWANGLIGG